MTLARGDQGVGRTQFKQRDNLAAPAFAAPFERFGVFRQIRLKINVPYVPLSVTSFV
jgi:hypothetical protein